MTESNPNADEIRRDIEATRADLAAAADALSAKLDVKAQANRKVGEVKDSVKDTVSDTASKMKASTPDPVQHALDLTGSALAPAAGKARPYSRQIAVGAVVLAVVAVVVRRRSARS